MKTGWELKRLGDICFISTGKSNTEDAIADGQFAFFDRSRIVKKSSKYLFDGEAIIIAGEGQTFLPKFYSGKFDLHQRAYAIMNFNNKVSIYYAYNYLIHFHKYFEEVAVGATAKSLRLRHFQDLPIPIPSLHEQHSIIAILDESFAAIAKAKENAEKNLANAREVFDVYMNNVFTNRDKRWHELVLGDVCDKMEYGTSSKSNETGKIPVLRMGNVQNRRIDWNNLVYSDDDSEITKYSLKYNDVLFNRTNSPELVGKSAIYKGEMPAIFAGYLIRLHRKEQLIDADFMNYYLSSDKAINYGKTVVISSVNQANINGTKLKNYPIPIPPLKEQQLIVSKLDSLSAETKKLETIYKQKLTALDELKKSILERAFRGELISGEGIKR
jgi:type I restriction enzyme S subunit